MVQGLHLVLGGLLIVYGGNLIGSGTYVSNGISSGTSIGGSSGGGSVNVFYYRVTAIPNMLATRRSSRRRWN